MHKIDFQKLQQQQKKQQKTKQNMSQFVLEVIGYKLNKEL